MKARLAAAAVLAALSFASFAARSFGADAPAAPTLPAGVQPVGADGKPLNLDFEAGTLKDWTATGHAFDGQPIKGDVVSKRRADMKSAQQGDYFILPARHLRPTTAGRRSSSPAARGRRRASSCSPPPTARSSTRLAGTRAKSSGRC
jgi:hypothetical protein